jgi:tetratricopeptide (TPR) repeat protein
MASVQGESQAAIAHFNEARILAERRDDRHALGVIFNCLANSYVDRDELEMATESLLASLEIRRSFGNKSGIGMILCNLAEIAFEQNDVDRAMTLVREGIEELGGISLDYAASSGTALRHLAFGHYQRGEYLEALDHGIRSFKVFKESAILFDIPFAMLTVALAQTGLGNWEGAVRMFATAERLLDQDGTKTPRFLARARAVALAGAQTHLSPSAFLAAKQIGNETDMDSAIRLVHTAVVESSLGLI